MPRPHGFENLGGKPRPKDKRDFGLAAYQQPVEIPESYTTDLSQVPVFYQGKLPACGAHAGAAFVSLMWNRPDSPKYLWKQIKLIDNFAPEDGTDIRSIMKSLANTGACSLALCPNDLGKNLADYTDPTQITDEQRHDAYLNDITGYAFAAKPSFEDIKQTIYQNKVVIALVTCGDGWWKDKNGVNTWDGAKLFPLKQGVYASGHFVVLYGYDKNYIYFRNSWSESWGVKGNGYFDQSYVKNVLELGTAIPLGSKFIFKNNLYFGLQSNDVLQLQKRLGVVPTTGYFGPKTLLAVLAYQKANGITPTGFCGPLTRASLNK